MTSMAKTEFFSQRILNIKNIHNVTFNNHNKMLQILVPFLEDMLYLLTTVSCKTVDSHYKFQIYLKILFADWFVL